MASKIRYTAGAFRLEHTCTHTEIHELSGGHYNLVEQIETLESLPCTECTILAAELEAEAAAPVVAEVATVAAPVAESTEVVVNTEAVTTVLAAIGHAFVAAEWEGPGHLFNTLSEFCEFMEYPVPSREVVDAFWSAAAA